MSNQPESTPVYKISTTLPVIVYTRPKGQTGADWAELDRGPGVIHLPPEVEVAVRIKTIDDATLKQLVRDLVECPVLRLLNLSENRNITDKGVEELLTLARLPELNLSSVSLTNVGMENLAKMTRLERLDISFCNRIGDPGIKALRSLRNLTYLNVQGCVKISHGGLTRIARRGLVINH